MLVVGWNYANTVGVRGFYTSLTWLSKKWMYYPIPLAGLVMIIFEIEQLINDVLNLKGKDTSLPPGVALDENNDVLNLKGEDTSLPPGVASDENNDVLNLKGEDTSLPSGVALDKNNDALNLKGKEAEV